MEHGRLKRQLQVSAAAVTPALGIDVAKIDPTLLDDMLAASIFWAEDQARTRFNGREIVELYDGNGTTGLGLRRWPIGRVREVRVSLPVLALDRAYTGEEIKTYRFQGRLTIFTYKLAAEHASLHLDRHVYGNILPPIPQCVKVTYTYGFPQYDPDQLRTTFDGGATFEVGDTRDPLDERHVNQLQQAVICDAAASFLGQAAALGVGLVQSVSFDGFSETMNAQAYGPVVEALITRRDALIARRKRRMSLVTTGA
jgi:hypothetical protein